MRLQRGELARAGLTQAQRFYLLTGHVSVEDDGSYAFGWRDLDGAIQVDETDAREAWRLHRDGESRPTIRHLHALSRFEERPDELVIELTDSGYVPLGSAVNFAVEEAKRAVLDTGRRRAAHDDPARGGNRAEADLGAGGTPRPGRGRHRGADGQWQEGRPAPFLTGCCFSAGTYT